MRCPGNVLQLGSKSVAKTSGIIEPSHIDEDGAHVAASESKYSRSCCNGEISSWQGLCLTVCLACLIVISQHDRYDSDRLQEALHAMGHCQYPSNSSKQPWPVTDVTGLSDGVVRKLAGNVSALAFKSLVLAMIWHSRRIALRMYAHVLM